MFYKQLSNSYGPISPEKTLLKCSRFDEKPAEITNSCEVPGYPAVKLSSTNFRQIFLVVLPGKGHSSSMTLKLSFAEKMTLFANLVIELKCQNIEHLPFGILEKMRLKNYSANPAFSSQPYCESIWLFSHVQCHTEIM